MKSVQACKLCISLAAIVFIVVAAQSSLSLFHSGPPEPPPALSKQVGSFRNTNVCPNRFADSDDLRRYFHSLIWLIDNGTPSERNNAINGFILLYHRCGSGEVVFGQDEKSELWLLRLSQVEIIEDILNPESRNYVKGVYGNTLSHPWLFSLLQPSNVQESDDPWWEYSKRAVIP